MQDRGAEAAAAHFFRDAELEDADEVVVVHGDRHGRRAEIGLLEDEETGFRLDGVDDLGEAGFQCGVVAGDANARIDETADIAARQVVEPFVARKGRKVRHHDDGTARLRPAGLVHVGDEFWRRQRRLAHQQRPAVVGKFLGGLFDADVEVARVGRVERVHRIQPPRGMAGCQPEEPASVIMHGRGRPCAKTDGFEPADFREIARLFV